MIRKILMAGAAVTMALSMAACGKTVQPGNEGILIKTLGDAGIQSQPLPVGWHSTSPGETIVEYPTITRNYSWTKPGDGDNKNANEELVFADSTGLPLSADLQITFSVDPGKVADIYSHYRLDFGDLLDGPVRSEVRTSLAKEASQFQATEMFSAQRQVVMTRTLSDVQKHFAGTGLVVSDIQWLGNIRAPQSVLDSIQNRTRVEQETQVAIQQKAKAVAEGEARIAQAEADQKVRELNSQALNSAGGERTLQQEFLQRWDGHFPQYMSGANPAQLMQMPSMK